MLISMIEHDHFMGRIVTGRVASGRVKVGDRVHALPMKGPEGAAKAARETGRISKVFTSHGGQRALLDAAAAGDIISIAGLSSATVTDTVAVPTVAEPLPASPIDPPTLKMTFGVNDSRLGGREAGRLLRTNTRPTLNVLLLIHASML